MKTIKEMREYYKNDTSYNTTAYINGYKDAIEGILEDIQNAEVINIASIEKYLQNLLIK